MVILKSYQKCTTSALALMRHGDNGGDGDDDDDDDDAGGEDDDGDDGGVDDGDEDDDGHDDRSGACGLHGPALCPPHLGNHRRTQGQSVSLSLLDQGLQSSRLRFLDS